MRTATIEDDDLVDVLAEVFSRYGYEGANVNRLVEASGLQRASLYYRFPGGKDEMVQAIIARATDRYEAVLAPAFADGDPIQRAQEVTVGLADYYSAGNSPCILIALTLSDDETRTQVGNCVKAWADGFSHIALDAGLSKKQAAEASLDAVAAIEGALVVSAATGDTGSFERALSELPARLTTKT